MKEKTKLNKIRALLGLEVKLEQMKLDNGAVIEAEVFEPGYPVFVVSEDERIPVPAGEYQLESGGILVVAEEGVIGEIRSAEQAPAEEQQMEEEEPKAKKVVESTVKETHFSAEDFAALVGRVEALEAKLAEQSKEEELPVEVEATAQEKKEVELEVKKHNPEVKKEVTFKHNPKRPASTLDRVFEKMTN